MYHDFMPNWKKAEQCYEEEKIEVVDSFNRKRVMNKDGKPLIKP